MPSPVDSNIKVNTGDFPLQITTDSTNPPSINLVNGITYRMFRLTNTPIDHNLFVSKEAWKLISVDYTVTVAGTDASAVTLQLTKCTGTQAPSAGTALLSATIDLKSAANTTVTGSLVTTAVTLQFSAGDRLAVDVTGTTTSVDGVITIGYQKM